MLNPGGSVKDRIGLPMIEAAERAAKLKPGGTIVEPTSGNTGVGLAIAAALKGYRMICVMPDKMSAEKIALLRAYGAEVVICPTAVPRESPQSYYSVAERLAREIPGAFQPNQYFNPANPQAHYETTGPEIWRQTGGRITHFVAGMGTGGTITGVGRYLKERKPSVRVVGADPEGSLYSGDTVHPYKVEGIGEDFIPGTIDLTLVDRIVRVSDKESFQMARRMTREEGILVGGSAGSALVAAMAVAHEAREDDVIVVLLPDTGRNYLSKIYSEEWMRAHGFLERYPTHRVAHVLARHPRRTPKLVYAETHETVGAAIARMQEHGISQMPVVERANGNALRVVGSIQERGLLDRVYRDASVLEATVDLAMDPPLPEVPEDADVDEIFSALLNTGSNAAVVTRKGEPCGVVTRSDLLGFAARARRQEV